MRTPGNVHRDNWHEMQCVVSAVWLSPAELVPVAGVADNDKDDATNFRIEH